MREAELGLPVPAAIEQGQLMKPCMEHDEHDGPDKASSHAPLSHQVRTPLPSDMDFLLAPNILLGYLAFGVRHIASGACASCLLRG